MRLRTKIVTLVLTIGLGSGFTGCSTAINTLATINGTSATFDGTRYELYTADFNVSKPQIIKIDKKKSYVIFDGRTLLLKDINGKIVIQGYSKTILNMFVREVNPGENTYVGLSNCGLYSVTIDVKPGRVYPIKEEAITAPLMSWCDKDQSIYKYDNDFDLKETTYSNNYVLVKQNIKKINKIIDDSPYQRKYDDFLEESKEKGFDKRRKAYIGPEAGIEIAGSILDKSKKWLKRI